GSLSFSPLLSKERGEGKAPSLYEGGGWGGVLPDMTGKFDFERFEGTVLKNLVPGAAQHGERQDEVPLVAGHGGKAAQFDGENNIHFKELGRFTRSTPFTLAFWMRDA